MAVINGLPLLERTDSAIVLTQSLLDEVPLPRKAEADALHIATAAVHGIEYLLTWNCTHIANATLRGQIERVCREAGFEPPTICTPADLPPGGA